MNTVRRNGILTALLAIAGMLGGGLSARAAHPTPNDDVSVNMIVTASVPNGKRMPQLSGDDISVKQGKERVRVSGWTPAQGDDAGLELFILIDDGAQFSLASQLDDVRAFILNQPATTLIGVGYTRNAGVQVVQDFTADHELAAKSLRIPLGYAGAYANPYLSIIDLMGRWPEHDSRREMIVLSDGVDRARRNPFGFGLTPNPDADHAAEIAQRSRTIIHSIYVPGNRRAHHEYWRLTNGQTQLASLSQRTGGQSFYLGLQAPVSIKPYLDQLETTLANQYLLTFSTKPGNKPGLREVKLSTDVAGVSLSTHDAVWVPASRN